MYLPDEFAKARSKAAKEALRRNRALHKNPKEFLEPASEKLARGGMHADVPGEPVMTPAQRTKQAMQRRTAAGSDFLRRNKNYVAIGVGSGAAGGGVGYAAGRNSKIPDGSRRGRRVES